LNAFFNNKNDAIILVVKLKILLTLAPMMDLVEELH